MKNPRNWWSWKWWLTFAGVFVLACVLVWFGYRRNAAYQQSQLESHRFVGQAVSINGNTIDVLGFHVVDFDATKSDYTHPQHMTVAVDQNTKYVKIIWHMLSKDEVAKLGGKVDPSMVGREQQDGSLSDLKNSKTVSIAIKSGGDTLHVNTMVAAEIEYNVQVYSALPTPTPKK